MGIIVGFVICGMIYLIIFFKSIKKTSEINQKAYDEDKDLVLVGSNANPPVCKIMDYNKFKYERNKNQK